MNALSRIGKFESRGRWKTAGESAKCLRNVEERRVLEEAEVMKEVGTPTT
jgi:hypothetical protein